MKKLLENIWDYKYDWRISTHVQKHIQRFMLIASNFLQVPFTYVSNCKSWERKPNLKLLPKE